jgi:hypothetical protein
MTTEQSRLSARWKVGLATVALIGAGVSVLVAQSGGADLAVGGHLSNITQELRQLRLAFEGSAQTDVLVAVLAAQRERVTFTAGRLDAVRAELENLAKRAADLRIATAAAERSSGPAPLRPADPVSGAQAGQVRAELSRIALREGELRPLQVELTNTLRLEEAKLTELLVRLEQMYKR